MGVTACLGEEGRDMQPVKPVAFTLNYTIPDADDPETSASDTGSKKPKARPEEEVINDDKLLYINYDAQRNVIYAGS